MAIRTAGHTHVVYIVHNDVYIGMIVSVYTSSCTVHAVVYIENWQYLYTMTCA